MFSTKVVFGLGGDLDPFSQTIEHSQIQCLPMGLFNPPLKKLH
jgi:hypothetical protein